MRMYHSLRLGLLTPILCRLLPWHPHLKSNRQLASHVQKSSPDCPPKKLALSPLHHLHLSWWRFHISRFSLVQSLSHFWLFATPWTAAHQASLSITNSWSLPKSMSIESVMPSNYLILCRPLLLPSIFHQGLIKWVSSSHQVAKVLEFQLQHHFLQWTLRTDLLQDGLVGSPCGPRDS